MEVTSHEAVDHEDLVAWSSQVEGQVAGWLGAADQDVAVGGVIDRFWGVADLSRQHPGLAGVAHAGAA